MKEAFDIMADHWFLTGFLTVAVIVAIGEVCSAIAAFGPSKDKDSTP